MKTILKDHVIQSFNRTNPFKYHVEDGEIFWVELDDCYSGQINSPEILRTHIDASLINRSVGPIAIKGALSGDVLCVEILEICLAQQGVMVTSPGLGVLGERIVEANTKIIPVKEGYAHFSSEIKVPLTPMIGVIGVAPKEGDIHCAIPGDHGANMDAKVITTGAKVYLPVAIDGAGLALTDLHACMGDGEVSGTGLEIAGKVRLKVTVLSPGFTDRPMVETADSLYTIASHEDIGTAIRIAVDDMTAFIMKKKQLSFPDAYRLVSATCDVQICQLVNKRKTIRVRAPKKDLSIAL